ncbi:exosortase F system-associated membrane protein [Flavobacterium selenitireducens]|uniref:exosortase F system-associated membrane protein n=1 Tax=Flavobacterium selenitireducens TaxID=2722704 RepID=UPI00168A6B8D|nr:exosortase F system-associated protein [Flavobacterium selenitireducens]MBD3583310.1 exosortase F system-associated protein [Flavobacterium selenitireducens]
MGSKSAEIVQKSLTVGALVVLLLAVRMFEDRLFYDPFLSYFRNDYLNGPLPAFDATDLFFGLSFRYFLNTMLSLGIIFVLFQDVGLLKFTTVLYLVFFVALMGSFFALLHFQSQNNFLIFYTRRFLIQPLFLLLFVPAFYYQKRISKK